MKYFNKTPEQVREIRRQSYCLDEMNINPLELYLKDGLKVSTPCPSSWKRIEVKNVPADAHEIIQKWISDRATKRWAFCFYITDPFENLTNIMVIFESKNDAVMFRLKGGQDCWK